MERKSKRGLVGEERRSQIQAVTFTSEDSNSIASLKKNQLDNYDSLESYKKLRQKRKKIAWVRMLVWLFVILLTPIFVFFAVVIVNPNSGHNFFGYTFYICSSESMRPVFDINDCLVVKNVTSREDIKVGVDIAFVRQSDGQTVTHRVIDTIERENGEIEYITRGVNNQTADSGAVKFHNIIGVRVKTISWLGHIIMFFRTPVGIASFIGILVLIVLSFYFSFRMSDDIYAVGNQ